MIELVVILNQKINEKMLNSYFQNKLMQHKVKNSEAVAKPL